MKKFADEKYNKAFFEAMKKGDKEEAAKAYEELVTAIYEGVKTDLQESIKEVQESNDETILAKRGFRQLTSKEKQWYKGIIEALKGSEPKQAFLKAIEDDTMPTTIIESVYKDLVEKHPLLQAINFQYVGYVTKWILNAHAKQVAVWGAITDEIKKEITSGFKVIDIKQSKLSAFAIIEKGMLDLGPAFLDRYVRTVLSEALLCGLENAIIQGNGINQPVGMIKDIHKGVSYSSATGYPNKAKTPVKSFSKEDYGALCAKLAKTEDGKPRTFTDVGFICNQNDYLTKVMPASTVLNGEAKYVNNVFPVPTTVYVSNELKDGEAVLFLKDMYFLGMGGEKNALIEYSDEYKFVEDQRVFKIKQYGAGQMPDNTCALYLDISKLAPTFITVKNVTDAPAA